jgi:Arc/MetJ family transcription regulator
VALESDAVAAALRRLFGNSGTVELERMRERALACARPDAARLIARFLMELLENTTPVSA